MMNTKIKPPKRLFSLSKRWREEAEKWKGLASERQPHTAPWGGALMAQAAFTDCADDIDQSLVSREKDMIDILSFCFDRNITSIREMYEFSLIILKKEPLPQWDNSDAIEITMMAIGELNRARQIHD